MKRRDGLYKLRTIGVYPIDEFKIANVEEFISYYKLSDRLNTLPGYLSERLKISVERGSGKIYVHWDECIGVKKIYGTETCVGVLWGEFEEDEVDEIIKEAVPEAKIRSLFKNKNNFFQNREAWENRLKEMEEEVKGIKIDK